MIILGSDNISFVNENEIEFIGRTIASISEDGSNDGFIVNVRLKSGFQTSFRTTRGEYYFFIKKVQSKCGNELEIGDSTFEYAVKSDKEGRKKGLEIQLQYVKDEKIRRQLMETAQ